MNTNSARWWKNYESTKRKRLTDRQQAVRRLANFLSFTREHSIAHYVSPKAADGGGFKADFQIVWRHQAITYVE